MRTTPLSCVAVLVIALMNVPFAGAQERSSSEQPEADRGDDSSGARLARANPRSPGASSDCGRAEHGGCSIRGHRLQKDPAGVRRPRRPSTRRPIDIVAARLRSVRQHARLLRREPVDHVRQRGFGVHGTQQPRHPRLHRSLQVGSGGRARVRNRSTHPRDPAHAGAGRKPAFFQSHHQTCARHVRPAVTHWSSRRRQLASLLSTYGRHRASA
jgi:hypothetical protein